MTLEEAKQKALNNVCDEIVRLYEKRFSQFARVSGWSSQEDLIFESFQAKSFLECFATDDQLKKFEDAENKFYQKIKEIMQ